MTELVVQVVWSDGVRTVQTLTLRLPSGTTVGDALAAQTLVQRLAVGQGGHLPEGDEAMPLYPPSDGQTGWPAQQYGVSIWGRSAALSDLLTSGDRLELCRPLRVDPKTARRERFQSQGARSAGLFKSRRPGAKAGY
jgi:uncharacterized protein